MKKIKFGYKMIAYFFVVVFLVVTIVAIQVRGRTINMLKEDLQITSQQTMEAAVNEFERYMKTLSLPIDLMCRRNELKKIDEAFEKDQQKAIKDALLGALKVIDHSERTYYATQSGKYIQAKLVISEEGKKTGDYILDESTFLQDKQWYKDSLGLKARNTVFSNFTKPYVNDEGVEVITVSQDLKASEEHVGVVAMDVNIEAFKEYINKIKLMNTGYTVLLDSDGNIIVNNDSNKIINKSATELEMWNDMIADIEKFEADEENADKHAMSCRSFSLNGDDMYVTLIKEPITGWYLIGFLGNDENEANIGTINKILLASLVLGIALGIAVALVITISISKELKKLAKATEIMAKGDLTQKLEIKRNDEFGELENNFNKMMDSISELIKEVSDGASEISVVAESVYSESNTTKESVGQVTTAIGGVANGATKQAMSTAQAKEDVESLSDNLAVSKEKLTVISDKSKGTGELSKKGAQILEELTKKSEKAKNNAASSIEIMSEMVKSLDKINYISDAIADITSQTNLLSLNASIEAARAGEAGKGFAVVADEIRKLAEQSNQSTEEIKNILSEITQNSNNVDTSLKESGTIQEEQQESINETDQLFSQIDSSIKELLEAVNELEQLNIQMDKQRGNVVKSMEQVSEVSESTAAATEEVNASTEQVAQTMIKIADSTKELNDIVGKLDISINHFKF